jgi:hypothetical protein
MRRSEYESHDPADFAHVTATATVGYLGLVTADGYPRVVPLNFVAVADRIYFHGAVKGEKYDVLKTGPKVTFSATLPYSYIPSYWISPKNACGGTMLYKSVLIKGQATLVDDSREKVMALRRLTEKYQPEGGHEPISPKRDAYKSVLKRTAVFRIDPDQIDVRVNVRQNKSVRYRRRLIARLEERGEQLDLATAEVLKNMLDRAK